MSSCNMVSSRACTTRKRGLAYRAVHVLQRSRHVSRGERRDGGVSRAEDRRCVARWRTQRPTTVKAGAACSSEPLLVALRWREAAKMKLEIQRLRYKSSRARQHAVLGKKKRGGKLEGALGFPAFDVVKLRRSQDQDVPKRAAAKSVVVQRANWFRKWAYLQTGSCRRRTRQPVKVN